jgi:hypothetical protein
VSGTDELFSWNGIEEFGQIAIKIGISLLVG